MVQAPSVVEIMTQECICWNSWTLAIDISTCDKLAYSVMQVAGDQIAWKSVQHQILDSRTFLEKCIRANLQFTGFYIMYGHGKIAVKKCFTIWYERHWWEKTLEFDKKNTANVLLTLFSSSNSKLLSQFF